MSRALREETPEERLLTALHLQAFGIQVYRERLRRDHPDRTEAELDQALGEWLKGTPSGYGRPAGADRWRRLTGERDNGSAA